MQKYLIIVGNDTTKNAQVLNHLENAGFRIQRGAVESAPLISINVCSNSYVGHGDKIDDVYTFYKGEGVKLLWPEDVLHGKAFDLDGATPKVDEQHPPKGYRLVTDEEKENTVKPNSALCWHTPCGFWGEITKDGKWNKVFSYCIPVECELKPKVVKMTVAEISKALGKTIEIVEG